MSSGIKWAVSVVVIAAIGIGAYRLIFPAPQGELFAQASDGTDSTLHPSIKFSYPASAKTVPAAFAAANQPYYLEDHVTAFPDPSFGIGGVIIVERALPITVIDGKKSSTERTWQGTVGDLLTEKNIDLGNDDKISPALATPLTPATTIKITRVARTNVTETSPVSFTTITQLDYTQFVGNQTIVQPGIDGQVQKTYLVIRQDGEQISKTLISTVTTKPTQNQIVKAGGLETSIKDHTSCSQYISTVVAAATKYKIDPNSLFNSMIAESNCHANSISGDGYSGLFQYDPGWWPSASAQAGYSGASIFDANAQIYTTAYQWAHGQCRRWPTCHL